MSQIRVKDYTGKVIHKKKRGFATKKEALEQKDSSGIQKDSYQRDYAERYPQMAEQLNCLSG